MLDAGRRVADHEHPADGVAVGWDGPGDHRVQNLLVVHLRMGRLDLFGQVQPAVARQMNFKEDKLRAYRTNFFQSFRAAAGNVNTDMGKMFQEKFFQGLLERYGINALIFDSTFA